MYSTDWLHKYPLFRLLLSFIGGILCGNYFFFIGEIFSDSFLGWIVSLFLVLFLCSYYIKGYSYRWISGLFVLLFFFTLGLSWTYIRVAQSKYPFSETESLYRVKILDNPQIKEKSILYTAELKGKKILLYFPKDSTGAKTIKRGDELFVFSKIALPQNNGNPDEFDYHSYLIYKEIIGTGYVADGNWKLLKHHSDHSFRQIALDCRQKIIDLYKELGFTGDEYAVLSALTIGYKEELSEDIRESFSVSGASHVLALSGLHIGFLYALMLFLLNQVTRRDIFSLFIKAFIILFMLWSFAFITGFSASVVRSVIMFSILSLSLLRTDRLLSFNSLITAALCMLVYNPLWLFDVGFQLSFVAVMAILLIQPWLYSKISVTNRAGKYIWGLITVSLAAQVGVAPLVLFYFSRFSTHFLLTNLLIIPLVTFIIYGAVLMLIFTPVPVLQASIAYPIKWLLIALNACIKWIEELPFSSLDGIWVHKGEVVLYYIIILFVARYIANRKPKYVISMLLFIFIFLGFRSWILITNVPKESIVFYNVRSCPVVHCISSDRRSWLVYADSISDHKQLYNAVSGYWNRLRLSAPKPVSDDNYSDSSFTKLKHVVLFNSKRICIINDDFWISHEAMKPLTIDYLYICKGYKGRIEILQKSFFIKTVVLDSALPAYKRIALSEECETLGFRCCSLAEGASISLIDDEV